MSCCEGRELAELKEEILVSLSGLSCGQFSAQFSAQFSQCIRFLQAGDS